MMRGVVVVKSIMGGNDVSGGVHRLRKSDIPNHESQDSKW